MRARAHFQAKIVDLLHQVTFLKVDAESLDSLVLGQLPDSGLYQTTSIYEGVSVLSSNLEDLIYTVGFPGFRDGNMPRATRMGGDGVGSISDSWEGFTNTSSEVDEEGEED